MSTESHDIDLVYLWVDGNDPQWLAKRNAFTGDVAKDTEINCEGRYANNDELRYSLRSVEKYAPWIRKIFIVTDNQTPDWLDVSNPKVEIVDHREIMPKESLPCFNASVIEYFLYKIPGLSERFLLANDDLFFNSEVTPDFFFEEDGYPIVRLKRNRLGKWHYRWKFLVGKNPGQYRTMVYDAQVLVEKKLGKYYSGLPHHNFDAYRRSDYQKAVEDVFREQIDKSITHAIRTYGDLHRSAFSYYALAIGHAHLRYVGRRESIRIPIYRSDYKKYLLRYQPKLVCLNDCQRAKDSDRRRVRPFLEERFPNKSAFELVSPFTTR